MRKWLLFLFTFFVTGTAVAQQTWNLRTVVEYAMANNITVRFSEVQAALAALNLKQSLLSQFPNAAFSANTALNSGSNQDPTSFGRITDSYLSAGMQLQSSADIFNFFSKRNTIAANEWEMKASIANVAKIKNDIALTAANAYLQILLAKEQEKITLVQVAQSQAQLSTVRKQVDAGALPELNATQLEAQLANDSVNYITAKGNVTQSILALKSYLSLDAATPFEVELPPVESIPVEAIGDLQPEYVYNLALTNQPLQQYNALKLKAADRNIAANRGAMYPTASLYGSLGSGFNSKALQVTSATPINAPFANVNVNGTSYGVFLQDPLKQYTYGKTGFFNQLGDNFRQSFGLNLNVPIFNGGILRSNYERSKLNYKSLELQKVQDDLKLKQDIYSAYTAALIALEKFNASRKAVETNERSLLFAGKRFEVGMLGTYDLLITQNNLLRARLEYSINQFDYVFKMKVLEFYKGQGLKL
ncbi:MAG: TolC family protein [Ferruginibacter sp.]